MKTYLTKKGIKKMRAFKNYNDVPEFTDSFKLPSGAYEVKIIRAEEQAGKDKDGRDTYTLCILFDISDGEHKDYFMKKFDSDKKAYPATAKFKGVYRLNYPNGGQFDENNEKRLKTALKRISESNNLKVDFTKEWDGAVLKNCKVGMIFRDEEYDYNGYQGMSARPYSVITLADLKEGKFKLPEPKYLNGSAPSQSSNASSQGYDDMPLDDDLPF